jgi:hypothetical protein
MHEVTKDECFPIRIKHKICASHDSNLSKTLAALIEVDERGYSTVCYELIVKGAKQDRFSYRVRRDLWGSNEFDLALAKYNEA